MGKKLRKSLKITFLLFSATLLLGFTFRGAYSQSVQPGDIVITEFMADPDAASDDVGEYIELYNKRAVSINIDGYTLSDDGANSHLISNGGTLTLPAESFVVLARSNDPAGDGSVVPDYIYEGFTLSNSGDEIVITHSDGTEIARLNYSSSTSGTSSELNSVENVTSTGELSEADYVDASNSFGSGDNGSPGSPGATSTAESPTVRFLKSESLETETLGSGAVTVLLQDPDGNEVNVDVVFESDGSSASESDFTSGSPVTITFGTSANDGEQVTVYPPDDDNNFEGTEKAVFAFDNLTTSGATTIGHPSITTLTIKDDDAPDIVFNEINADPGNDANGDGTLDSSDDEFVEIVNNENTDIDISGWTLSDESYERFTFPQGTVIPAGNAVVVFADTADGMGYGGAYLFNAGALELNNGGERLTLSDAEGTEVVSVTFPNAGNDQSLTRSSPELTGSFENHSSADTDDGSLSSPGTKIDGSPFGSKHAIAFRGTEGWRMVASPVQNATFNDFFGNLWMQGVTGSDDPSGQGTLFSWSESGGGSYTQPGNMSDPIEPGSGYFVYVFEDDQYSTAGVQGGFPKIISSNGTENNTVDNITVSATDESGDGTINRNEGWNLLGNPFGTDIKASAVIDILEGVNSNVNTQILVWDHDANAGNGTWVSVDGADGSDATIAPFQAFFVRFGETATGVSGTVSFDKSSLQANQGTEFYKNAVEESIVFDLNLHGEQYYDTFSLEFNDKGSVELDRYDAYKLFSLNSNSINLFSTLNKNRLQKSVLPRKLDSNLEIPLSFDAAGRTSLKFKWNSEMKDIPSEWDLMLIDKEQNREIDLRRSSEYKFTVNSTQQQEKRSAVSSDKKSLLNKVNSVRDSRFVLSVQPKKELGGSNDLPESVKLNPNYPNPFNPQTTIPYEISQNSEVKLTVWNMIGQKVATLVDGLVEAGTHEETWNASNMPSGIYIARFEVNGKVFTRKMTLIK